MKQNEGLQKHNLELDMLVKKAGITSYKALATKLCVMPKTVYDWRNGKTLPRFDLGLELARILGISPYHLLKILTNDRKF